MNVFVFIIAVAMTIPTVMAADPVFSPITVTDSSGNQANGNSTITWGALLSGLTYISTSYVDGGLWGLGPLFDIATSFINTVLSKEFPYDILLVLWDEDETFDIGAQYTKLITLLVGFVVCIVIGVLYIWIMPIVGCCICCCRCCCENCGGAKNRKNKDTDSCYCIVFSIVLLVCAILTFVGCVCIYVTNDNVEMEGLLTSVNTNILNLFRYLTNMIAEFNHAVLVNYNFTVDVVNRDLDNIESLLGVTTRDKLNAKAGIDAALNAVLGLDTVITSVGTQLLAFNASIANIKSVGATLATELADAKADVDAAKAICISAPVCLNLDTSVLALDINFNNLPDISTQLSQLVSVQSQNLTANVLDGRSDFDNIPQRVQNETRSVVSSIKSLLGSFYTTIEQAVSPLKGLPAQLESQINPYKLIINSAFSDYVLPYDKYRIIAGIVLACLALIVVVLQILALLLSCCGFDKEKDGHERTQTSDSAGKMYLASAGFVFIFTWFLMLLCVIFFLIGATLEKFVCQPLEDPNFTIFEKLIDNPTKGSYVLAEALLQNASIPLTASGILRGCRANRPVFSVLKLDSLIDLNQVTNYKSSVNITGEFSTLDIDLTGIKILSTMTENQLRDFSSATQIDNDGFLTELNMNTTKTNLDEYAANLRIIANGLTGSNNAAKSKLKKAADKIEDIHAGGTFAAVESHKINLTAEVNRLNETTFNIPTIVNNTIDAVKLTDDYMANNASACIKDQALGYGNRILMIFDQYVTKTLDNIANDVGKCAPIYNVYNSIISVTLCTYIVDTLNGFWFSIGWCILFETVGVIFAIKLAKFLLRMNPPNEDDEKPKKTFKRPTRVAPADDGHW